VKPSRIHCVYIPGRKKVLKLACSTSTVRRDDTMMMMMMALTNHTNHSKHTQKPTQKNTHNPLTHSRSHSKTTLGNFAQNSVLQRFFLTSKQRKCKCVDTQIFENDDGKNCLLSDHICTQEKAEFLEENDERLPGPSSEQQRPRTNVGTRKMRSSTPSQPHAWWVGPVGTPTTSVGRLFRFHIDNLRVLFSGGFSFSGPPHRLSNPPVFLVSG
jgi:hypothetical protein